MDKKEYASPGRKEKGEIYELIFMLVNHLYHFYLETQMKDKGIESLPKTLIS